MRILIFLLLSLLLISGCGGEEEPRTSKPSPPVSAPSPETLTSTQPAPAPEPGEEPKPPPTRPEESPERVPSFPEAERPELPPAREGQPQAITVSARAFARNNIGISRRVACGRELRLCAQLLRLYTLASQPPGPGTKIGCTSYYLDLGYGETPVQFDCNRRDIRARLARADFAQARAFLRELRPPSRGGKTLPPLED